MERLEDCRVHGQSDFRPSLLDSMARVRASSQKRDPSWFLGMQRVRFVADAALLRDLSARLGGCASNRITASNLLKESLLPLYASPHKTSGRRTASGRIASAILAAPTFL